MDRRNGKNKNFENTFPGCLGRIVNLFDLDAGLAGNRLLADKPHHDGLHLRSSGADVAGMSTSSDQVEDRLLASEMRRNCSNGKSNGTPMKMLIAQEMSKEVDSKRRPPNVVAKLMGLETLPQQPPDSAIQRSYYGGHPPSHPDPAIPRSYYGGHPPSHPDPAIPRSYYGGHPPSHSVEPVGFWEKQNEFFQFEESNEYKDVYEMRQQSKDTNCSRDNSPLKVRYCETISDKKIAVFRQKFIEAKRLSTDEKLRQSKQFQDALEILSSNKDLFFKCMQESNPALSPHCQPLQSIPSPEKKRITILRPSKIVNNYNFVRDGNINKKQMKSASVGQLNGLEKRHTGSSSPASWNIDEHPAQQTRIIVLKPSPVRPQNIKPMGPSLSESPRMLREDSFGIVEDDKNHESREIAKAITQQMREKLGKHRGDETLLSSVLSNGYIGDESSFNKSEIEYAAGDLSDSEVMSPICRHSWDYVNNYSSPYYSSSFSHASYSPESSVYREAKKRLSERWALTASNGSCLGQKHTHRSPSTLGEMLALTETKKPGRLEEDSFNKEQGYSNSHFIDNQRKDENVNISPRSLLRSKSVPVTSAELGTKLNAVTPESRVKPEIHAEATKTRMVKSSFKGTVASLFFYKNKKINKDISHKECGSTGMLFGQNYGGKNESLGSKMSECLLPHVQEPVRISSSPNQVGRQSMISEAGLATKRAVTGSLGENQDQPSPISVLERLFEEEEHTTPDSSGHNKPDQHGLQFPSHHIKSNLIDKSPLIGSVARTLSWDDGCLDKASSYHPELSMLKQTVEEEEREWIFFVQTLLSAAGLTGDVLSASFWARLHSSKSPLDPSLRDNYLDFQDKETLHEANRRRKRSTQKLVFDCVNAALVDIAGYRLDSCRRANASLRVEDQVWARISTWISGDFSSNCGDDSNLLVERVVTKEVVGKGWVDWLRREMDNLRKAIEGKLLEDLVQEAVEELTDGI